MRNLDELRLERATERNDAARLNDVELGVVYMHLAELVLYQSKREFSAVYGHIAILEEVWYRADMVLVTVGHHYTAYLVAVEQKIRGIGYYKIHARRVVCRERRAAIDYNDVVCEFERGHILAYFAYAA